MSEDIPIVGLRERKRYAAMRLVQEVALDLFDAHGYADVTVERIAAASDISPSSVYRYFGTKEHVVLWDEYDPIWSARIPQGLRSHPPLDTLRFMVDALVSGVLRSDQARLRRRISLIMREPSVEAASALQAYRAAEAFGTAVSEALRCLSCGVCNECDRCLEYCPEGILNRAVDGDGYVFDLEYCKGCGVCMTACPRGAIYMADL